MPDIPAARNTLRVLAFLAWRGAPVRASAVARDLGLPRSSMYQLIRVLMDEGFVVHYPEDQAYGLSNLLSEIGTSSLRSTRLNRLAQPLLERLVADTATPVVAHLAVLGGADVIYVSRVQAFRAPTTVSSIGVRLPAHLTATGRSLLAALPRAQVRALYQHRGDLVRRAGRGPTTLGELDQILTDARERGWSRENGEITADYASVASAVLDRGGYPVAAVGVTYRAAAVDAAVEQALGEAMRATATSLTSRLSGR
jgi:DNA-binding IclR family transcriptional regulator